MEKQNLYSTQLLHEHILYCDNQEDFKKEILDSLQSQRMLWKEKVSSIMEEKGYNLTAFAKLCKVSRVAVKKWCDGSLPQSRELFVRIGFAADYNLTQMNQFLQRFGRYPALYPKSLEDSVYIFVLNSETLPHTFAMCEEIEQKIHSAVLEEKRDAALQETGSIEEADYDCSTAALLTGLLDVETETQMASFVQKNKEAYRHAYENFYAYVKAFIEKNNTDIVTGKTGSLHALAELQNWSSSLRKCAASIYRGEYFPQRRKVIALGLYLNMNLEQLNIALCLAGMEELYAKNPLESAIIYALQDAELNDMIACDGNVEAYEYVCKVLKELQIPEAEEFISGL